MLGSSELSAREKVDVLRKARDSLWTEGDSKRVTVRQAISNALRKLGYLRAGLGGHRETTTTIEIARALRLGGSIESVKAWAQKSSPAEILKGLDTTIAYLK